jgi:hypothetical protein
VVQMARAKVKPRARKRNPTTELDVLQAHRAARAVPHTVTITIPEELGELVAAGLELRAADNAMTLIAAAQRFHVAVTALLRKRKG